MESTWEGAGGTTSYHWLTVVHYVINSVVKLLCAMLYARTATISLGLGACVLHQEIHKLSSDKTLETDGHVRLNVHVVESQQQHSQSQEQEWAPCSKAFFTDV